LISNIISKFVGLVFLSLALTSNALVILQQVNIPAIVQYESNPILLTDEEQSAFQYILTPNYIVTATEDTNTFFADVALNIVRSSNQSVVVDREDPTLSLGWRGERERDKFNVVSRYTRLSSRQREFRTASVVDIDATAVERSLIGDWTREITDKWLFTLSGRLVKAKFDGGVFGNSLLRVAGFNTSYRVTDNFIPYTSVNFTDFRPDGIEPLKAQDLLVGAKINLTDKLSVQAGAGFNHIDSTGSALISNAAFNYGNDRYNIFGNIARTANPSNAIDVTGGYPITDSLGLGFAYYLSEIDSIGTDFSINKNKSGDFAESKLLNVFYNRDLSLYWKMRLFAGVRTLDVSNDNANNKVLGITIIYNTPQF
jgi:hypothetical protein